MVFKVMLNQLAKLFYENHYARRVGMRFYEENYLVNFGRESVKLFMESYFDLAFCTIINLNYLWHSKNLDAFITNFDTPLDSLVSIITIVYTLLLVIYPIYGFIGIHNNQGRLHTKKV